MKACVAISGIHIFFPLFSFDAYHNAATLSMFAFFLFSAVAWCAKLNVIACATETCVNGIPRFVCVFIHSVLMFS